MSRSTPPEGARLARHAYKLDELAIATGFTPRAIRSYVEKGLISGPVFRGASTTYDREHLLQLHAIRRLRQEEHLRFAVIKKRLAKISMADLEAMAPAEARPPAEAKPKPPPRAYPFKGWDRVALLPGLELHLRSDASPLLRRVAEEIFARYGAAAPPEEREAPEG